MTPQGPPGQPGTEARVSNHPKKPVPHHRITPWKSLSFYLCVLLFLLTCVSYFLTPQHQRGDWLWPLIFVPLLFYLIGLIYGDIPSRYYQLSALKPFPIPFSMQFDRAVIAIVILFSGLILNALLLGLALLIAENYMVSLVFGLYMAIMMFELPHSVRIFRYLQHVQMMRLMPNLKDVMESAVRTFGKQEALTPERLRDPGFSRQLYSRLKAEAQSLVREGSPLGLNQQIALNLTVRGGEALYEAEDAAKAGNAEDLAVALGIITALCEHGDMEMPPEMDRLLTRLEELRQPGAVPGGQQPRAAGTPAIEPAQDAGPQAAPESP